MAEQPVLPAGPSGLQDITALEDSSTIHPSTHDNELSTEDYKPLPPGCWTVPFHGNCPRCHHHHRAAQVQVKITEDPKHVSHVRCEKCQEKWAAFGGLNTTRISLLSTTTTEPDNRDREVRYRLIEIVDMAVKAKAQLGTVTESPSAALSRQPSETDSTCAVLDTLDPSDDAIIPGPSEEAVAEANRKQQEASSDQPPGGPKNHARLLRKRDRTLQLFSRLKLKFTTQLSKIRKSNLKLQGSHRKPANSIRQCNRSRTRTPRSSTLSVVPRDASPAPGSASDVPEEETIDVTGSIQEDVDKTTGLFSEVATFIAKLDQDELKSRDDQGRAEWMREAYTEFKNGKKQSLRCSSITETSIAPSTDPFGAHLNRRSYEVSGTGTHIDGLRDIVPFLRRHSIAMSEGAAERLSVLDGSTAVPLAPSSDATLTQRSRPETGPQPHATDRSSVQSHRRSRHSFELSLHSRAGSLSTLPGHARSRLSQGSMRAYGSMTSIPELFLRYNERRPSSPDPSLPRTASP